MRMHHRIVYTIRYISGDRAKKESIYSKEVVLAVLFTVLSTLIIGVFCECLKKKNSPTRLLSEKRPSTIMKHKISAKNIFSAVNLSSQKLLITAAFILSSSITQNLSRPFTCDLSTIFE